MKFTGLTISLALSGLGYSAALPVLGNVEGPLSSVGSAVGGVTGSAAKIVAPITSTTDGLTGSIKRDDTAALGETVQTIPSLANSAVRIAGSAVGTGESLVSGVAGTAENSVAGAGPAARRQLNDLVGSTLGSAVPAIIQEAKAGGLAGAIKRDGTTAIGETVATTPSLANSAVAIAGSAVGTGESLVSGVAGTAENSVAGAGPAAKRQLNNLVGSTLGSAVPAIIQEAKAGGLAGGIKRDGPAALGETVETIPALAHNGLAIAGSAVGTGESLVSGAAGTAENAVGHN
ncbi:hypothetical protein PEX1_008830 [Penicillium expansum]|nr:hypothetical protein PEXP_057440 [Penicillium expansum]KGO64895.1 hypothetical protein PEX1_008830 [Penicillium expansum]